MYEIPKIWDAKIEKRRFANLSLSYPLTCISAWLLASNNSSGRFGLFVTLILILCFGLFYVMSLIIILSPLINFSRKINELSRSLFQDKLESIFVSVPNKETEFFNQFNKIYFSSSADNFHSLIKLKRLTSEEKIIWLYSEGNYKEKHKSNLKALYHFIGELFCTEDKMFIENVIVEYFQNKNGALYSKDKFSNTHSKWSNNKGPKHLKDMSESIKSLMKYR